MADRSIRFFGAAGQRGSAPGSGGIYVLRREVTHKRTCRLYKLEELNLRAASLPERANQLWNMDFSPINSMTGVGSGPNCSR
ncbi:MAG: hypothetical protein U5K69_19040 [Balneolaceae bacterium]|nr:hypothetical protein [Balneolaceae bacterium]